MTRRIVCSLFFVLLAAGPLRAQDPAPIVRLDISPDTLRLTVGETAPLRLTAHDAAGADVPHGAVAWFSGWENARVDTLGNLTALNPGQTVAGATLLGSTAADGTAISARIVVVVGPAEPAAIRLTLPGGIALPGRSQPAGSLLALAPVAVDALGNERWDVPVTLASSDPGVVEVIGHAIALRRPGTATLRAEGGGTTAEQVVTVGPPLGGAVQLAPASAKIMTGEAIPLRVTAGGRPVAWPEWWVSGSGEAAVHADDYFVAEKPGTYQVAATVGDRVARATIEVTPRPPAGGWLKVGHIASPTREIDLWVFEGKDGRDYAYTGSFGAQMRVYDVTDPAAPVFTDSLLVPGRRVNDIMVNADATLAVITQENDPDRKNGIIVLDLADPAHPTLTSHFTEDLTAGIHTTYIVGDLVYAVNDGTRDIHIVDISDPAAPRQVGRWGLDTERKALHDIAVTDGLAYLSYWDDGLVILDVGAGLAGGTPTAPAFVSRVNYPEGNTHTAWRWKDYVFVGDEIFPSRYSPDAPGDPRGYIHVIDVRDIFHPREVGKYEVPEGGAHNVWITDDVLYVAYYQRGLRALDLSGGELRGDLYAQGREIDYFLTQTSDSTKVSDPAQVNRTNVFTVVEHKGHLFAIDASSGLWIMKLERPKDKEIARR
ncbi:MAG: LVIVD repeat-containing protein [Gemmatimonadota bacterium]